MSESGGVGLADMIMQKFGGQTKLADKTKGFSNAISAVRDIKQTVAAPKNLINSDRIALSADNGAKNILTLGNPDDVEIISRFSDEVANFTDEEKRGYLTLDGKILNSTRPRIVPTSAFEQSEPALLTNNFSASLNASEKVSFQMPVNGRISSDFGSRFHPVDRKVKFHGGIDIAVPKGTPVGAAADGIVKFAGWKGGYGNVVVLKHGNDRLTTYAHLSAFHVAKGERVEQGDTIGTVGSTGFATGPHLHFEVKIAGQLADPLQLAQSADAAVSLTAAAKAQLGKTTDGARSQLAVAGTLARASYAGE